MKTPSGATVVGLALVLFGVLLLLNQTGLLDIGNPARWIPSILVALGVWALVSSRFRNLWGPLILIGIGVVIQVAVLSGQLWGTLWPMALIIVGLVIVFRAIPARRRPLASADGRVQVFSAFWGAEHNYGAADLRGGQITVAFGGADLDLRDAHISRPPAVIDVLAMFGGIDIRVPDDWRVQIEALGLFGGTEDSRRSGSPSSESKLLIVRGLVLFGGLEIKT
ncbi:MAG: LiaF-related protein [Chloroflexi bacterium]|nr:LiaF-related protein [Chloroflexota bacterium]